MVRIEGLSLSRRGPAGRIPVLAGIDMAFPAGSIGAVVGPTGCGKTSLVRAMCGLARPDSGRVLVGGLEATSTPVEGTRKDTAVIFQDYGLLPWKSVEANAGLPLEIAGLGTRERRERVLPVLEELGLAGFRTWFPARLSGGMQQRVAVARALVSGPSLLLMDEPFSSLDALTREDLQDTLLEVWRRHRMTIVIVTHSIEEAAWLADRVYVLAGRNPGKLAALVEPNHRAREATTGPAMENALSGPDEASPRASTITCRHTGSLGRHSPGCDGQGRGNPAFHAAADEIRRQLERSRDGDARPLPPPILVRSRVSSLRAVAAGLGKILAVTAAILTLWAILAAGIGKPFFPGPMNTLVRLVSDMQGGELPVHVLASARRISLALLIALPLPALLGLAAGRSRRVDALVSPLAYFAYPVPKIAFLPVLMLLFGLGDASKVAVIVLIVATQVLIAARDAARGIAPGFVESARSLGAGRLSLLHHVIFPASLPALLSALRTSLGTATAVLFFAETFATDKGLGYAVMDAWTRVDYPGMYAAILALSLFGLFAFVAVDLVERLTCSWRNRD